VEFVKRRVGQLVRLRFLSLVFVEVLWRGYF